MQKKGNEEMPDIERQGWNVKNLHEESSNQDAEDTLRRTLRGDENKGNPDERDIVGSVDSDETPHGREETKIEATRSNANDNG